jgi:hypothetical protein
VLNELATRSSTASREHLHVHSVTDGSKPVSGCGMTAVFMQPHAGKIKHKAQKKRCYFHLHWKREVVLLLVSPGDGVSTWPANCAVL